MLPQAYRLTRPDDFRRTIRGGVSVRRPTVIVYGSAGAEGAPEQAARAGVTVSKAVGGSVVRHRVARVIRHELRDRLPEAPSGSTWVVRALPAAGAPDAGKAIAQDVSAAFHNVLARMGTRK